MIELTFVLLLFAGGEAIEYTPYDRLSECLSTKRVIKRNTGVTREFDSRWVCRELTVELEEGADGKFNIIRIISEVKQ